MSQKVDISKLTLDEKLELIEKKMGELSEEGKNLLVQKVMLYYAADYPHAFIEQDEERLETNAQILNYFLGVKQDE